MPLPKHLIQVTITIHREDWEIVKQMGKQLGMPGSRLVRNLFYTGLDDAKLMKNLGVFNLVSKMRGMHFRIPKQEYKDQMDLPA